MLVINPRLFPKSSKRMFPAIQKCRVKQKRDQEMPPESLVAYTGPPATTIVLPLFP
eukprot:UN21436